MPGKASLRPALGRVGNGFAPATCEEELWRQTLTSTYVHFMSFMFLNGSPYCVNPSPLGYRQIDLDKFLPVIGVNISFIGSFRVKNLRNSFFCETSGNREDEDCLPGRSNLRNLRLSKFSANLSVRFQKSTVT
jgi:hypothetical protein